MKPKWIVAIILASVVAGMALLTCGTLKWAPLETPVHAAQATSDPWNGLAKGWILASFLDGNTIQNAGTYEIVDPLEPKDRVVKLPFIGERIRLRSETRVVILGFKASQTARLTDSPASVDSITSNDDTGIMLAPGNEVVVEGIRQGRRSTSADIVPIWFLVSPPRR